MRGNQDEGNSILEYDRSIPASAGEPRPRSSTTRPSPVYPRECGGTAASVKAYPAMMGLSPRVRGNQPHGLGLSVGSGSIPASAGEPRSYSERQPMRRVYPRECGGTRNEHVRFMPGAGLSPRVRGNHPDQVADNILKGSIPASAGEPEDALAAAEFTEVYPRECGGT